MSIAYLQQLLPLSGDTAEEVAPSKLLNLSESETSTLLVQFEQFLSLVRPLRQKVEKMKSFLETFNTDVQQLSHALVTLQEELSKLTSHLDTQRDIVEKLNPVILDLVIPPQVAESVVSEPINAKWLENIRFLSEKLQLVQLVHSSTDGFLAQYKGTAAFEKLQKGITILEAKAVERVRDHMIAQIRLMRSSLETSSQLVQEGLLSIKEAFSFLSLRHPELGKQLQLAYIYTMKWYYTTRFAKYLYALQKLQIKHVDASCVLSGSNDHSEEKLGLFRGLIESTYAYSTAQPSGAANPNRVTVSEYLSVSSVNQRIKAALEEESEQRSIPSQIAETTPFAYWLEFIYLQWANALMDNVIVEYLFFVDFFNEGNERFEPVKSLDESVTGFSDIDKDWAQVIFGDVFKLGSDFVQWLVTSLPQFLSVRGVALASGLASTSGSCDSYGILLMIRLTQNQQSALHNDLHIPVMDEYLNAVMLLLWPHFTRTIDLNCEAIRRHVPTAGSNLRSGFGQASLGVTQQFARFIAGLSKLAVIHDNDENKKALFKGEPVQMSILRLRNDFEGALTKASSHMFGLKKNVKKEIFLFNNYLLIVTILRNELGNEDNAFVSELIEHFELLCDAYKNR